MNKISEEDRGKVIAWLSEVEKLESYTTVPNRLLQVALMAEKNNVTVPQYVVTSAFFRILEDVSIQLGMKVSPYVITTIAMSINHMDMKINRLQVVFAMMVAGKLVVDEGEPVLLKDVHDVVSRTVYDTQPLPKFPM